MVSEAWPELLAHLRGPPKASPAGDRTEEPRGGGETKCELRPTYRYIGIRGIEPKSSLMIAARASLVKGMRMRYFRLRHDGPYSRKANTKTSTTQPRTMCMAASKILVVTCKMRFFNFFEARKSMEEDEARGDERYDNALTHAGPRAPQQPRKMLLTVHARWPPFGTRWQKPLWNSRCGFSQGISTWRCFKSSRRCGRVEWQ